MTDDDQKANIPNEEFSILEKDILTCETQIQLKKNLQISFLNNIYFDGPVVALFGAGTENAIIITAGTVWFLDHLYYNQYKAQKIELNCTINAAAIDSSSLFLACNDASYKKPVLFLVNPELMCFSRKIADLPSRVDQMVSLPQIKSLFFFSKDNSDSPFYAMDLELQRIIPIETQFLQSRQIKVILGCSKTSAVFIQSESGDLHYLEIGREGALKDQRKLLSGVCLINKSRAMKAVLAMNKDLQIHKFDEETKQFSLLFKLEQGNSELNSGAFSNFNVTEDNIVCVLKKGKVLFVPRSHPVFGHNDREITFFSSKDPNQAAPIDFMASCKFTGDSTILCFATNSGANGPDFKMVVFKGHSEVCSYLFKSKETDSFTPNNIILTKHNELVAIGTTEGHLGFFERETMKEVFIIKHAHSGKITGISMFKDTVITTGCDGSIKATSTKEKKVVKVVERHHDRQIRVMTMQKSYIWTVDERGFSKVMDLERDYTTASKQIGARITDIAISSDLSKAVAGDANGYVYLFTFPELDLVSERREERCNSILSIIFTQDSKRILYLAKERFYILSAETADIVSPPILLTGSDSSPAKVIQIGQTNFVYAVGKTTIRFFDLESNSEKERIPIRTKRGIQGITMDKEGRHMVTIENEEDGHEIKIYDNKIPNTLIQSTDIHQEVVKAVRITRDNKVAYTLDELGHLYQIDMETRLIIAHAKFTEGAHSMDVSHDSSKIHVVSGNKILVISSTDLSLAHELEMANEVQCIESSQDGLTMLVAEVNGKITLVRTVNWDKSTVLADVFQKSIQMCKFLNSVNNIVGVGDEGILKIYHVRQNFSSLTLDLESIDIQQFSLSRGEDSSYLAISFKNSPKIKLMDLSSPEELSTEFSLSFSPVIFDFSGSAYFIAAASGDGQVELFDVKSQTSLYKKSLSNNALISALNFSSLSSHVVFAASALKPNKNGRKVNFITLLDLQNASRASTIDQEVCPVLSLEIISNFCINDPELKIEASIGRPCSKETKVVKKTKESPNAKKALLMKRQGTVLDPFQIVEDDPKKAQRGNEKLAFLGTENGNFKIVNLLTNRDIMWVKPGCSSQIVFLFEGASTEELLIIYKDTSVMLWDWFHNKEIRSWSCIESGNKSDLVFVESCFYDKVQNTLYVGLNNSQVLSFGLAENVKEVVCQKVFEDGRPIKSMWKEPGSPFIFVGSLFGELASIEVNKSLLGSSKVEILSLQMNEPVLGLIVLNKTKEIIIRTEKNIIRYINTPEKRRISFVVDVSSQMSDPGSNISVFRMTDPECISHDLLAVGFENGDIGIFNGSSFGLVREIPKNHLGPVTQMRFSKDCSKLYSVSVDFTFKETNLNSFDNPLADMYHTLSMYESLSLDPCWFSFNVFFNMSFLSCYLLNVKENSQLVNKVFTLLLTENRDNLTKYISSSQFFLPDFKVWHYVLYTNNLSDLLIHLGSVLYSEDIDIESLVKTNHMDYFLDTFSSDSMINFFTKKYLEVFVLNLFVPLKDPKTNRPEVLVTKKMFNKKLVPSQDSLINPYNYESIRGNILEKKTNKIMARISRSRLDIFSNEEKNKSTINLLNIMAQMEHQKMNNTAISKFIDYYWDKVKFIGKLYVFIYSVLYIHQYASAFTFTINGVNFSESNLVSWINIYICVVELLIACFYVLYEFVEILEEKWKYLAKPQNIVDLLHVFMTITLVTLYLVNSSTSAWAFLLLLFLGLIRLLYVLQNIDAIRTFTYRLTKVFFDARILFFLCAVCWFGFVQIYFVYAQYQNFMEESLSDISYYDYIWNVYNIFFGNWDNPDLSYFTIYFFCITVLLCVVMMNVLIVVIGESFTESKAILEGIDNIVKLENILEFFNARVRLSRIFCLERHSHSNKKSYFGHYLYLFSYSEEQMVEKAMTQQDKGQIEMTQTLNQLIAKIAEIDAKVTQMQAKSASEETAKYKQGVPTVPTNAPKGSGGTGLHLLAKIKAARGQTIPAKGIRLLGLVPSKRQQSIGSRRSIESDELRKNLRNEEDEVSGMGRPSHKLGLSFLRKGVKQKSSPKVTDQDEEDQELLGKSK